MTVDFSEGPLIAIMGVNGAGKSTILHALACCYKPDHTARKDYKFTEFFLPNTFALWNDSDFTITYSYREGAKVFANVEKQYCKKARWSPKYDRRPERYVSYFGISSCVPDIEADTAKSFMTLTAEDQADSESAKVLDACKFVLNIPYQRLAICKNSSEKEYLGVLRNPIGYCTSLSMGAGEQRVFKILREAYRCPKYSMLLIDELDLLLHDNALKRLIAKLHEIATDRNLQIIFTSHAMLMADMPEFVKIRYLVQTPDTTLVQTSISTDLIAQLTGNITRPIQIFVEDTLSRTIITQICTELNCKRFVQVFLFGPAINSFTVIAGKVLNGEDVSKTIAVLDGDVYVSVEDKQNRINQVITGQAYNAERSKVLNAVLQYDLPPNQKPEMFIRTAILGLPYEILPDYDEYRIVLEQIGIVDDDHKYIDDAIKRLDMDYQVGLAKMVDLFSKSTQWDTYTTPIKDWLATTIADL